MVASARLLDQIGRVLGGRYRVLAPIGTGASAHVFLADDVTLRRRVAVKILHPALAGDDAFLRRFQAEARAAAALAHPNVMAVYDWGEEGGTPFLVCEFLAGGSLRGILDRDVTLSPSQALLVGLQAARGLDYAHKRGLAHRDIKPANLLFDDEGRLRIADFGLARALAEAAWTEPAGAMLGTARYASPEQVQGSSVDGKADVYALGLVLVEAVTGSVPFAADTTIATLMGRVDKPLVAPASLGALGPIVEEACRPDPAARLDARALATRLEAAAAQLPRPDPLPLAGAVGLDETVVVPDRDPTMVAAPDAPPPVPSAAPAPNGPVAAAVAATTTTVAAATGAPPAGGAHPPAAAARKHRRWPRVALALAVVAVLAAGAAYALTRHSVPSRFVPDVQNKDVGAATAELRAAHFKWVVTRTYVDNTRAGQVVFEPLAKTKQKEGTTVRLTVSNGPTPVPLPDLLGVMQDKATQQLQALGLTVGNVTRRFDDTIPAGGVVDWTGRGAQVPKGSAVDLVVSAGPRRVPDDLVGKTFDAAKAELTQLGLTVGQANGYSDDVQTGQVFASDPPSGSPLPAGGKVTLKVSQGPATVTIPGDLIGKQVAQAQAELQALGLTLGQVYGPSHEHPRVFDTNPSPGARVARGSSVDLFVK
jgi:serine/threonine-protein kinase